METRQATPGAMKLPPGAKERERFNALEAKVLALTQRVESLESIATESKGKKNKAE